MKEIEADENRIVVMSTSASISFFPNASFSVQKKFKSKNTSPSPFSMLKHCRLNAKQRSKQVWLGMGG